MAVVVTELPADMDPASFLVTVIPPVVLNTTSVVVVAGEVVMRAGVVYM